MANLTCITLTLLAMKTTIHLSTMIDKMKLTFLTRIFLKIACVTRYYDWIWSAHRDVFLL